jgi:predicted transcriptional regulator
MAEPKSIFDWVDEERFARAIAEARADFDAGRTVPHEVVAAWLERMAKGERPPPPLSHTLRQKNPEQG